MTVLNRTNTYEILFTSCYRITIKTIVVRYSIIYPGYILCDSCYQLLKYQNIFQKTLVKIDFYIPKLLTTKFKTNILNTKN